MVHWNKSGSYKLADATGINLARYLSGCFLSKSRAKAATEQYYVDPIVDDKLVNRNQLNTVRRFGWEEDDDT